MTLSLVLPVAGQATDGEAAFRATIEARKDRMLAASRAQSRTMVSDEDIAQAKRNVKTTEWGRDWLAARKEIADFVVSQPD